MEKMHLFASKQHPQCTVPDFVRFFVRRMKIPLCVGPSNNLLDCEYPMRLQFLKLLIYRMYGNWFIADGPSDFVVQIKMYNNRGEYDAKMIMHPTSEPDENKLTISIDFWVSIQ
eukprot:830795_1